MKSLRPNQNGAAVIEFAVLLLLLVPLLFGIIEFGFLWAQSHYLSQATREGARAGARIATYDSAANKITNQAEVQDAVNTSVKACLETAPFYKDRVDKIATISPPLLVFFGATQPALEVNVTVNSAAIWPPMLWQLLTLLPSSDGQSSKIEELTDSAVFAITSY
jgi:Flp pilus assembly protein TadG